MEEQKQTPPASLAEQTEGVQVMQAGSLHVPDSLPLGNDAGAQRARLLEALRRGSVSTLEARRLLNILHPGGRVLELRKKGFGIETVWVDEYHEGNLHRVGRYLLRSEPGEGGGR